MGETFLESHRWDLCKAFLERADRSAELLRGLTLSIATAGLGYALHERSGGGSAFHVVSAILFGGAVALTYISWDLQKRKARKRFKVALEEGTAAYLIHERDVPSNREWDLGAASFWAAAACVEIALAFRIPT